MLTNDDLNQIVPFWIANGKFAIGKLRLHVTPIVNNQSTTISVVSGYVVSAL